jgi:exopolysaccharide biosynthesis operon protein EpsL
MIRTRAPLLLASVALVAHAGMVRADADDTVNILAAASYYRDSNIFRLAPDVDPHSVGLAAGKSDTVRSAQLGLRLDKRWSLQRLQLDATTSANRYGNYSYLNYNANIYRAAWLWQFTPRLTGSITADRQQTLVNYADYRSFSGRNVRTDENRHFDADWWLHGSWHLIGGIGRAASRYDSAFPQQDDYRLRSANAGLKYVAESGSWLSLVGRRSKGSYPNLTPNATTQIDNDFRQDEIELRANWQWSAISSLDARVAQIRRRHATYGRRDYSGLTGQLAFSWQPSAQVQVGLTVARNIASYQDNPWLSYGVLPLYSSSYYVDDSISLTPVWNFSAKADLRFKFDYARRHFKGEIFPSPYVRRDTPRTSMAAFDWMPTRALTLSTSAQREHRASTLPGYDYDDSSVGVNAQLLF